MKSGAFWLSTDWRFDSDDRRRLLELFKNDEFSIVEIERAVCLFKANRESITESEENPTQIKNDLEELQEALEVLTRILMTERGTARALFCGEASDQIGRLMSLFDALEDSRIINAAQNAADGYETRRGRPVSGHPANRKLLFKSLLRVIERTKIKPARKGNFADIIETIYAAIGEGGADGDIREHLANNKNIAP